MSCDQVPGEKKAKNPTEKFPGAQVWDLFSAKMTKNGQFWPKIAQKSPGGQKYEFFQKNFFTTLCIYIM